MSGVLNTDSSILKKLREGLASGAFLRDGRRLLAERNLAESLGITRAVLRRALDQLERDGAIFRRQGQGNFVLPPPPPHAPRLRSLAATVSPQHLMEVRLEIEPTLAALAAERSTPNDLRQLESFCKATQEHSSPDLYESADEIFHYKIAQMSANPLFISIYEQIRNIRRTAAWTETREKSYSEVTVAETAEQHEKILCAITQKNSALAATLMQSHLLFVSNARLRPRWYD